MIVIDVLRRAGAAVTVASVEAQLEVVCSRGIKVVADKLIADCTGETYDLIACPVRGSPEAPLSESPWDCWDGMCVGGLRRACVGWRAPTDGKGGCDGWLVGDDILRSARAHPCVLSRVACLAQSACATARHWWTCCGSSRARAGCTPPYAPRLPCCWRPRASWRQARLRPRTRPSQGSSPTRGASSNTGGQAGRQVVAPCAVPPRLLLAGRQACPVRQPHGSTSIGMRSLQGVGGDGGQPTGRAWHARCAW